MIRIIKKLIEKKVGSKIIFFSGLLLTLLLMTLGGIEYFSTSKQMKNELYEMGNITGNRMKVSLMRPLWDIDTDMIKEIVKSEIANKEIKAITIYNNEDEQISAIYKHDDGTLKETKNITNEDEFIIIKKSITKDKEKLGTVNIFITTKYLNQSLNWLIFRNITSIIIFNVAIALLLLYLVRVILSTPLNELNDKTKTIIKGNLSTRIDISSKDELGEIAKTYNEMINNLLKKVNLAQAISKGDLTQEVHLASSSDTLGIALQKMRETLYNMINSVQETAKNLKSKSTQLSETSKVITEGANNSAANIEQISASIIELNQKVDNNLTATKSVNNLSQTMLEASHKNNQEIQEMNNAINEISTSSEEISKIIKTIESIAFQTNLLALNAAVESARAGAHGKGFAVVAEEVRALAGRSTKAAQEISELIEQSAEKVKNGTAIIEKTTQSFTEINSNIKEVSDHIETISKATEEQSEGVSQISTGLKQIEIVTQKNSAHSEGMSSSAKELEAYANGLNNSLKQFKLS